MSVREEARVQPARDERAIALYVGGAQLALLHACCFVVATGSYAVLRVVLEVPHPRAGAAAYLLVVLVALAIKFSWSAEGRDRLALLGTSLSGLLVVEGLLWLLVHRGGQGTLSAGATGLLLGLMLLTASDRRILFRG